MLPIGDENPENAAPPVVTWVIIAVNVLAFVVELMSPDLNAFVSTWGAVPSRIAHGHDLITLLTSMFLHGSLLHIGGNMLFLKVFGDNVEDAFGHWWFLAFYFLTGLAAHAAYVVANPNSIIPTVGASGAISGVLGAYIVLFRRNRVRVLLGYWITTVPAWLMIGLWAAMQFVDSYLTFMSADTAQTGGVAYAAHVGGFVSGVVFALIARSRSGGRPTTRQMPERYY